MHQLLINLLDEINLLLKLIGENCNHKMMIKRIISSKIEPISLVLNIKLNITQNKHEQNEIKI